MARTKRADAAVDLDLEDLPPMARWREWLGRAEAVIFASPQPVTRETLARVVGKGCNLDALIDDIRAELRGRPYELVAVAGGWSFRTKLGSGDESAFYAPFARTNRQRRTTERELRRFSLRTELDRAPFFRLLPALQPRERSGHWRASLWRV